MGGGGFSEERNKSGLDDYVLAQCGKSRPKVCFLPTASGDSETYIERFYAAFKRLGARPSHLSVFKPSKLSPEKLLLDQDIIYVGGGNTRNLLILWEAWRVNEILRRAYDKGALMTGMSAGGMCWFQRGLTDSFPGTYSALSMLGWLKGSYCPHFDSEPKRRRIFRSLIKLGRLPSGYAVDDGVGLHFVDGALKDVVTTPTKASARFIMVKRGF